MPGAPISATRARGRVLLSKACGSGNSARDPKNRSRFPTASLIFGAHASVRPILPDFPVYRSACSFYRVQGLHWVWIPVLRRRARRRQGCAEKGRSFGRQEPAGVDPLPTFAPEFRTDNPLLRFANLALGRHPRIHRVIDAQTVRPFHRH